MDLAEPDLHPTLAFSLLMHMHTLCTVGGILSCLLAECIKMQFCPGRPVLRAV